MSESRAGVVRSKPLVRWIVLDVTATVSLQRRDVHGIVTTHGYDQPDALLLGAKRFRCSQHQLVVVLWDDAPQQMRHYAALAEHDAVTELLAEALR